MKYITQSPIGLLVTGMLLAGIWGSGPAFAQANGPQTQVKVSVEAKGESVEPLQAGVYLAGTTQDAGGVYPALQEVSFEAVAHNPGYWRFSKWTGYIQTMGNPLTLTMKAIDAEVHLNAVFEPHSMYDYVELFDTPGMPAIHWDIRPETGFGSSSGQLEVFGFHGPNTLGATTYLQDLEWSVWFCMTDARETKEIPDWDQQIDFELRRTVDGNQRTFVRITPNQISLTSQEGDLPLVWGTYDDFHIESRDWNNLRVRVLGKQMALWLRQADGTWGAPILRTSSIPTGFQSEAYAITAHPDARYRCANLRIRGISGDIEQDIGFIDQLALTTLVTPEGAAQLRPSGGNYPPNESMYVQVLPAPEMVFEGWEDVDGLRIGNKDATNAHFDMETPRNITATLRKKHSAMP